MTSGGSVMVTNAILGKENKSLATWLKLRTQNVDSSCCNPSNQQNTSILEEHYIVPISASGHLCHSSKRLWRNQSLSWNCWKSKSCAHKPAFVVEMNTISASNSQNAKEKNCLRCRACRLTCTSGQASGCRNHSLSAMKFPIPFEMDSDVSKSALIIFHNILQMSMCLTPLY